MVPKVRNSWLATFVGGPRCGTLVELDGDASTPPSFVVFPNGLRLDPIVRETPPFVPPFGSDRDVYRLERTGDGRTAVYRLAKS